MTKSSLIVMLLPILVACQNKQQTSGDSEEPKTVVLHPESKQMQLTDVADVVEWIELKEEENSLIGNVKKMEIFDSDFYFFDNVINKCILRFSGDGKFLNRIGTAGNGAGEYPAIYDFTIDRKNRRILVLSHQSDVYIYTLEGRFEEKIHLSDVPVYNISANTNGVMASSAYASASEEENNFLLYEFNREFKPAGEWISYPHPILTPHSFFEGNLISKGDFTYYIDYLNLRILRYDCKLNKVDTLLCFNLSNPMPEKCLGDNMMFIENQLKYNWLKGFIMTDSEFMATYIYDGKLCMSVFDTNGNITFSGQYKGFFPDVSCSDKDEIYSYINSDSYMYFLSKKEEQSDTSFSMNDSTNTLVMKWKIKAE